MKIVWYIILILLFAIMYYYVSMYYPYVNEERRRIDDVAKVLDQREINDLKESIIKKEHIVLDLQGSVYDVSHLIRIKAQMAFYSTVKHTSLNSFDRIERRLWAYMSYINFSYEDMIRLYIYHDIYRFIYEGNGSTIILKR